MTLAIGSRQGQLQRQFLLKTGPKHREVHFPREGPVQTEMSLERALGMPLADLVENLLGDHGWKIPVINQSL